MIALRDRIGARHRTDGTGYRAVVRHAARDGTGTKKGCLSRQDIGRDSRRRCRIVELGSTFPLGQRDADLRDAFIGDAIDFNAFRHVYISPFIQPLGYNH